MSRADIYRHAFRLEAEIKGLRGALLGVAHAHDGTQWCWCAYTTLMHPPDDPQDGVEIINGHTEDCWRARAYIASPTSKEGVNDL
jgi:hypothetical protein